MSVPLHWTRCSIERVWQGRPILQDDDNGHPLPCSAAASAPASAQPRLARVILLTTAEGQPALHSAGLAPGQRMIRSAGWRRPNEDVLTRTAFTLEFQWWTRSTYQGPAFHGQRMTRSAGWIRPNEAVPTRTVFTSCLCIMRPCSPTRWVRVNGMGPANGPDAMRKV